MEGNEGVRRINRNFKDVVYSENRENLIFKYEDKSEEEIKIYIQR